LHKLIHYCKTYLGLSLNKNQIEAFILYQKELLAWNQKFNLTSITTLEGIETNHFIDSVSCAQVLPPADNQKIIDIGCGAGFPGIPIKILLPKVKLTLVDSVQKKTVFCEHILNILSLDNVIVVTSRAEELGQNSLFREQFDNAIARAVAPLPILVEYLLPLVKVGGFAIAQKSRDVEHEIQDATPAINELGGEVIETREINIPDSIVERYLVLIKKISPTIKKYPRRPGIPAKRPIS